MTNTIEIENLNISDLDIPTDETLQEVATACENIATSSESIATSCDNVATSCNDIAKDTTLRSTNTALGSLATDATLQATNTALGSISGSLSGFATDTTLQAVKGSIDSVASAEGTLNTTLGAVAKDATLQSTNTALGSLAADTTLQATNTALGSLMADTTGQSIASAISGLGQTLGSDKANIDGSNIADKATFRSAIGVKSIVVENKSKTTELPTIAANSVSSININVSKTDYTPSGIMGITGTGTSGLVIQEYYLTGTTATVYFRNVTSSSIKPSVIRLTMLYIET